MEFAKSTPRNSAFAHPASPGISLSQIGPLSPPQMTASCQPSMILAFPSHSHIEKSLEPQLPRFFRSPSKIHHKSHKQLVKEVIEELKADVLPPMIREMTRSFAEAVKSASEELKAHSARIASLLANEDKYLELIKILDREHRSLEAIVAKLDKRLGKVESAHDDETAARLDKLEKALGELRDSLNEEEGSTLSNTSFLNLSSVFSGSKLSQRSTSEHRQAPKSPKPASPFKISLIESKLPPVLIEYRQLLTAKHKDATKEITLDSFVYFVDREGFLLDDKKHYLLDKNNTLVRLDKAQLELLNKHHMLE